MDYIEFQSILTKQQQLVEKKIDEGFKRLNLLDISSLKVTLRDALEQDDATALQDILNTFKAKNKDSAANRKKLKDDEKKTKLKQNASSNDMNNTQDGGRPRRKAFANANERVNKQITQTLNSKLRREDVIIKTERISELPENQTENEQTEMPPPAAAPKRAGRKKKTETKITVEKQQRSTSTRSTRSRNTNAILEEAEEEAQVKGKRSDVVLIEEPVPLIALDSNDENTDGNLEDAQEETRKPNNVPKHSAIEKTRVKNSKRFANSPVENKKNSLPKRPKWKTSKMDRLSEVSQYEDAVNSSEPPVVIPTPTIKKLPHGNQEVVIELPNVLLVPLTVEVTGSYAGKEVILNQTYITPNSTVVVEKPRVVVQSSQDGNAKDIMTDDESETESPPVTGKSNVAKELFNPFENSPLKKKVEAFEKLGSKAAATEPARVTRTNTRQKANNEAPPTTKTTYSTPTASNRMIPKLAPTTKGHLSKSAKKALSAIKHSSQRQRHFEQAAKEKEAEALHKKEIMLQKQSEDKRRKREEKEAKAKQQREEQEKERLKLQELQKAKEELHKKRLQQQAERAQKQREDAEKRRLLAKAKHEELKREEERKRLEEERKRHDEERQQLLRKQRQQQDEENRAHLPIYMTHKAPLLPTPDCYDSDDENAPSQKCTLPSWNKSEVMQFNLRTMHYVPPHIRNTLFCPKPQTPDLQELFPNVDPRKLRRNSSAIWKEAPRFTMMPHMNDEHV